MLMKYRGGIKLQKRCREFAKNVTKVLQFSHRNGNVSNGDGRSGRNDVAKALKEVLQKRDQGFSNTLNG